MTTIRRHQQGFTVIELLVVIVALVVAGFMIFIQFNNLKVADQDNQRKTAINAMYYALEEVYFKQHGSYPATLSATVLPSIDAALFTDPGGFTLGKDSASDSLMTPQYHYDATNCDTQGNCKGYTLRADMAKEAQYVKKNRSH